jgi:hypothetical protein
MPKRFIIRTGTEIRKSHDVARSATEALRLIRDHMRMRRPNLTIEDEDGNPITMFDLKEIAEAKEGKQNAPRP